MKVKVNRQLKAGRYNVNFEVSDFTPEEVAKMSSFGVPTIELQWMSGNDAVGGRLPLTQIQPRFNAVFGTEQSAKEYEEKVLTQVKAAIQLLRESKDEFSSSEEVTL
jgi:hypothetical protein